MADAYRVLPDENRRSTACQGVVIALHHRRTQAGGTCDSPTTTRPRVGSMSAPARQTTPGRHGTGSLTSRATGMAARNRFKGALASASISGVDMEQWQYEVTSGGRIWYCIDEAKRTLWMTTQAPATPKPRSRRTPRDSRGDAEHLRDGARLLRRH